MKRGFLMVYANGSPSHKSADRRGAWPETSLRYGRASTLPSDITILRGSRQNIHNAVKPHYWHASLAGNCCLNHKSLWSSRANFADTAQVQSSRLSNQNSQRAMYGTSLFLRPQC